MKTVFVSSTFKDMHYERDAIRLITAPRLNGEARKYGDEFDFCDLRWGINTGDLDTEEGSKKVLDVCLDEIDRCDPPMVVLLGERYGWIPEADLIKTAAERKKLELDDFERSVTALEIEYGALCDDTKFRNTLFYFREIEGNATSDYLAEDDEHAAKISAFKSRIRGITGGRIKNYKLHWTGNGFDGVEDFAKMLAEDITSMLMPSWKERENLTSFEREREIHNSFIREKGGMFRARQAEAEKLINLVLSQSVTIIKGKVGSGKSTLLCHMATELKKKNTGWTVLPFISGLTTESSSAADIIENTVYFIEEQLHVNHYIDEKDPRTGEKQKHTSEEWRTKLAERCFEYTKTGGKLLIMLDAADQLTPSEERDRLYFIPMSVSDNIRFAMTCIEDFDTPGRDSCTYMLELLEDDENKRAVISGTLSRSGKELSESVINEILMRNDSDSDNPLYLSLLIQRLLMMNRDDFTAIRNMGDGMSAIEERQRELINECPSNLNEMSVELLNEAGKRINENFVLRVAEYLAASRNGLRKKELSALLGGEWTEIDFSHFINYMNDCFLLRNDGRYDFMHKSIREGFRSRCRNLDRVKRELLEHFKRLDTDDPVRKSEIIYHTIQADDKRYFVDYITEYESHDDQSYINCAARDTYAQCSDDLDCGAWMVEVLNEIKKYDINEKMSNLVDFVNFNLNYSFSRNQKDLRIRLNVLTSNVHFSKYLYNKLETNRCKRALSVSYEKLAEIYGKIDGRDNLGQALELCCESLELNKQLSETLGTPDSREALSISFGRVAEIYEKFRDEESLECALRYYHDSLALVKQLAEEFDTDDNIQRNLAVSYGKTAGIYERFGGRANLKNAREMRNEELAIMERLESKLGTVGSRRDLSISCHHAAGTYMRFGRREDLEQALKLNQRGLELSKKVERELISAGSRIELSNSYTELAGVYEELDDRANLNQALELYRMSLEIDKQMKENLGTVSSRGNFADSCNNAARIYEKLGGSENLKQALELYYSGLNVIKQLADELGTSSSIRNLSFSYNYVGGVYEKLGGNENLTQALEMYQKGLKISEQMAEKLGTSGSRRSLSASYNYVGGIYEQFGGKENLEQALDWYLKGFEISKQVAEELDTVGCKRELSVCYENIARIHESFGSKPDLEKALEMYRYGMKIKGQLAEELDTEDSKRDFLVSCSDVRRICQRLDDGENLEKRGVN